MCKYLLDHCRVFDTGESLPREHSERFGYYLDSATASYASCNIDIEYSLEVLCPTHRSVTVCRLAVARLTVFLTLVAFAAFSRCYRGTVLAVWLMRHSDENAMESGQVSSRPGYQSSQAHHEIQWLEDNVGSAISIRRLQLVANVAV